MAKSTVKIVNAKTGKTESEAAVIRSYFGFQPGQNLTGFMAEIKALTPEDKTELALGAAAQLGYSVQ